MTFAVRKQWKYCWLDRQTIDKKIHVYILTANRDTQSLQAIHCTNTSMCVDGSCDSMSHHQTNKTQT